MLTEGLGQGTHSDGGSQSWAPCFTFLSPSSEPLSTMFHPPPGIPCVGWDLNMGSRQQQQPCSGVCG